MNTEEVYNYLSGCIEHKRPCSLVRANDGEGLLFCGLHGEGHKQSHGLMSAFGKNDFTETQLAYLYAEIFDGYSGADIIGYPMDHIGIREWDIIREELSARGVLENKLYCSNNIQAYLWESGFLEKLITGLPSITIINHNDLEYKIKNRFKIGKVTWIKTVGSARDYANECDHFEDVFPYRYIEIKDELRTELHTGEVFLVGMACLSKPICKTIKLLGGIAIDIGSVLDGWAGRKSRSNLVSGSYEI
jgi:hypothetical protein